MTLDHEEPKLFDLFYREKTWVGQAFETPDGDLTTRLLSTNGSISINSGEYLVAGNALLKNGETYPVVVDISSDDGGEIGDAFWKVEGVWLSQNGKEFIERFMPLFQSAFPVEYHLFVNIDGNRHPRVKYTPPATKY